MPNGEQAATWVTNALARGELAHLTEDQRRHVEAWGRRGGLSPVRTGRLHGRDAVSRAIAQMSADLSGVTVNIIGPSGHEKVKPRPTAGP